MDEKIARIRTHLNAMFRGYCINFPQYTLEKPSAPRNQIDIDMEFVSVDDCEMACAALAHFVAAWSIPMFWVVGDRTIFATLNL